MSKQISTWFGITLGLMAAVTNADAQTTFSQPYGSEADYRRLYYLNQQYIQSWLRSDTATYNRLLWAEDFVHQSGSDGLLYPKKKIMEIFGKPRYNGINYFYTENTEIHFITNDAAMVYSRTPYQAVGETQVSYGQYNDVYVRRNNQWICVSANITNITSPGETLPILAKTPVSVSLISYVKGSDADISGLTVLNDRVTEVFFGNQNKQARSLLADDFMLQAANGLVYKKEAVLTLLHTKQDTASTVKYQAANRQIRFIAHDIAMIHAVVINTLNNGTKTALQFNDTYVKRNAGWTCVAATHTPVRN